jgi:hypothetical protein
MTATSRFTNEECRCSLIAKCENSAESAKNINISTTTESIARLDAPSSAHSKLFITMATATPASSVTGQGALLGLPSKSQLSRRGIDGYSLPDYLIQDKASLKTSTDEGLPVYKVTKVCVLIFVSASAVQIAPLFACPYNLLRDYVNMLYSYIYI